MSRLRGLVMSELRHGVRTTYAKHGCRCDLCKASEREQKRKYRATEKGKVASRRSSRHQAQMGRLAVKWLKANQPDVYKQIRREVYSD